MFKTAAALFIATASLASSNAFAADYSAAKAACADAIALKQGKSLEGARTKLVSAHDGSILRINVELSYADGAGAKGECRIRRGEIQSVEIGA